MKRIHVCSAIKNRAFVNSQALTMAVCIRTDDSRARRHRDRRPVWLVDVERESSALSYESPRRTQHEPKALAIERLQTMEAADREIKGFHCRDMPDIGLHPRHSGIEHTSLREHPRGPIDPAHPSRCHRRAGSRGDCHCRGYPAGPARQIYDRGPSYADKVGIKRNVRRAIANHVVVEVGDILGTPPPHRMAYAPPAGFI